MRDLLTGLAIVLIVVLTTMLVAPYFVDWTGQRAFLEGRLTHALGQKVTVGGNIDLKLLPTPYLVLDHVVIGNDDAPIKVGIRHLDLELTVAPLLHGEFDIVEARLEQPTIRVALDHDRTLPAFPPAPAFQADVRFDRIQVWDGTLAIADPISGRTLVFDHLDLDADAGSFTGPFKVNGEEGPPERRTPFRLSTTAAEKSRTHARLVVEETAEHAGFEIDGGVDLAGEDPDKPQQSFDGTLALFGHLAGGEDHLIGWRIAGPLRATPQEAVLDTGELRLGTEEAGVSLKANGNLQLGESPKLALDLAAKQLDFDRLAGAPVGTEKPAPPKLPDLATLRTILGNARPPVQTVLNIAVDEATYGLDTLSDLQVHLGLGENARQPLTLSGDGPGGLHVALDGDLMLGGRPTFAGTTDIRANDARRAADWLASVAPSFPWKGSDLPFATMKLAGQSEIDAEAIDFKKLDLNLERSVLSGSLRLAFATASKPSKIIADVSGPALDVDVLPSIERFHAAMETFDVDLRLHTKALKVSSFGAGALDAGPLNLRLAKAGDRLDLSEFRAEDFGGATIAATGRVDATGGVLGLSVKAARLNAAATLARQLVPGLVADALTSRADAIAPADLRVDATLVADAAGLLRPSNVKLVGTLGSTRLDVKQTAETGEAGSSSMAVAIDAPDGARLLAQLLPQANATGGGLGAGRLRLNLRRSNGEAPDVDVTASLGTTSGRLTGRFDLANGTPTGSGALHLQGPDVTPLLLHLAVAGPGANPLPVDLTGQMKLSTTGAGLSDLDGRIAATETRGSLDYRRGTGDDPAITGVLDIDRVRLSALLGLDGSGPAAGREIWSNKPFATGFPGLPSSDVRLQVHSLDLAHGIEARNAQAELRLAPSLVRLDRLAADLLGGQITGAATVRRDGAQAIVEGHVALGGVSMHSAAFDATASGHLTFVGGGTSPLGLVTSLAGTGDAVATNLSIPTSDPAGLPKVFQDLETDVLAVDHDAVIRAFEDVMKEPFVSTSRAFSLSLASGVLHLAPNGADASGTGSVTTSLAASFDLAHSQVEERLEDTLTALPPRWTGAPPSVVVILAGPPDRPQRSFDVTNFLNGVAARALARETARVEAFEFDIRERALFNARLQAERRFEEEKQKAEAERKARLEAARQERIRREQAAKAAREQAEQGLSVPAPQDAAPAVPPNKERSGGPVPPTGADPSNLGRY